MLSGFPLVYQKLQDKGVPDAVSINKIKFKPYGNLVDQGCLQFNDNVINNHGPHSKSKNHETTGAEFPNEHDSKDTKTNKTSVIPRFVLQILPDDDVAKGTNSLNSKQSKVFCVSYMGQRLCKKYDGHKVEPVEIFLSCSGGRSKSHLVKLMYNATSKTLLYHCKDPEKPGVLLLEFARRSTGTIGATNTYFGLGIKPRAKLISLNKKI